MKMPEQATETVQVWTLTLHGEGGFTVDEGALGMLIEEIRMSDTDARWTITSRMMPRAEYDALPEFDGF